MRPVLSTVAGAACGVLGLGMLDQLAGEVPPATVMATSDRFRDVSLTAHDGETVRFYEDLIKGKTVAINFMYVACKNF